MSEAQKAKAAYRETIDIVKLALCERIKTQTLHE